MLNAMLRASKGKQIGWTIKRIGDDISSFATRLILFAIVEGWYFSSSFASIFCIKKKNVLPGLCLSNECISCYESLQD